jgi:PadR family transcriptional regulator PadR
MGRPNDLVQGTLGLLILKTISLEVLQVQQGSLYPALQRLEQQGWIRSKWGETETGRQARFYSLTAAGRSQLEKEREMWSRLSAAVDLVIES